MNSRAALIAAEAAGAVVLAAFVIVRPDTPDTEEPGRAGELSWAIRRIGILSTSSLD